MEYADPTPRESARRVAKMGPARANSDQRAFIQRDQLVPRALSLWFVVNGFTLVQRHVLHAPAMQRARVDLDFRRTLGGAKRFIQFGLRVRLLFLIVGGNPEGELCLDLRNQQVRTV